VDSAIGIESDQILESGKGGARPWGLLMNPWIKAYLAMTFTPVPPDLTRDYGIRSAIL
jgi:hypothetical protein